MFYTLLGSSFIVEEVLAQAAHRTPPGSSALRESEASANVLSVRKRSDSNKINHTFDDEQNYKNTYSLHQDEVLNAKTICYNHLVFKKF
ncbi:hypothetical protein ACIQGW_03410 [Lysinibacillus xylanilyticus]|uniref:hypothetical protein n=1 Tax=Lysinibacillus xylanilyticus TaxID=582475 RepID=UPI00381A3AC9